MNNLSIPDNIHTWKHNKAVNNDTVRQLMQIKPHAVCDVGCGDGFYGKIVRHFIPNCYIIGIEKNHRYSTMFRLYSLYDKLIIDDIININFSRLYNLKIDLIIFGDVLEHLEDIYVHEIVSRALDSVNYIIINSPVGFQPQDHEFEEEIHKCGIYPKDFADIGIHMETHYYCNNTMFNLLIKKQENPI